MKAKIRVFNKFGHTSIHFNRSHADYTLCGLDNLGDPHIGLTVKVVANTETVDCPDCIGIVEYCKSIKRKEYK